MKKTQLQLRIEASVRNNQSYAQNTYFIDTQDYRDRSFFEGSNSLFRSVSEDEIKSGNTYEDIKPAVQARLACMEFGNDLVELYNIPKDNLFDRIKVAWKYMKLQSRNDKLMKKAVKDAVKRNGGYFERVLPKYLEHIFLSAVNLGKKDKISEKDLSNAMLGYIDSQL